MADDSPYEIMLTEEDWDRLKALPRQSQQEQAFKFLWQHIAHTPTAGVPGKLKELKGQFKGLYQLAIGDGYRLIYRVDENTRQVFIEDIGPHPDWKKSRKGQIRR